MSNKAKVTDYFNTLAKPAAKVKEKSSSTRIDHNDIFPNSIKRKFLQLESNEDTSVSKSAVQDKFVQNDKDQIIAQMRVENAKLAETIDDKDRVIASLKADNAETLKKYKKMKKSHNAMLHTLFTHQHKVQKYEAQLRLHRSRNVIETETLSLANEMEQEEEIANMFTSEDQRSLNLVPLMKQADTEFARKLFCIVYRGEEAKLSQRSMRSSAKKNTLEITPEKKQAVKVMLLKRMEKVANDDEKLSRMDPKYIQKIMSQALRHHKLNR